MEKANGYIPGFVRRGMAEAGITGLRPKLDENGNPLQPTWAQMAAKLAPGKRKDSKVVVGWVFGNADAIF